MQNILHITDAELEIMKVLWCLQKATGNQIIEELAGITEWKPKTILTLIKRLTEKNAVRAEKTGTKAFLYTPLISENAYRAYANQSFLQKVYNGSLKLMLTSFVKENKFTELDIENLKKIIDEEE